MPLTPCPDHSSQGGDADSLESSACNGSSASNEGDGAFFRHSNDLLQGRKTVAIAHNGSVYRLQATRLGKLILTK